ncbi:AP-3 complex subunit delta [Collariella sp. IMI 366227]|nr:AP-3 complex subunit delta [Collariella sp. IMI 366227]
MQLDLQNLNLSGRGTPQSLLQVDSSTLNDLSLDPNRPPGSVGDSGLDQERQQREEAEMAQALKEVQRLRLEMQRANERIQVAQGVPVEGVVVRRKKKSVAGGGEAKKKKKVKRVVKLDDEEPVGSQ